MGDLYYGTFGDDGDEAWAGDWGREYERPYLEDGRRTPGALLYPAFPACSDACSGHRFGPEVTSYGVYDDGTMSLTHPSGRLLTPAEATARAAAAVQVYATALVEAHIADFRYLGYSAARVDALLADPEGPGRERLARAARTALTREIRAAVSGGWTPAELVEVISTELRRAYRSDELPAHLAALASTLRMEAAHPERPLPAAWLDEIAALPAGEPSDPRGAAGIAQLLEQAGRLRDLPRIPSVTLSAVPVCTAAEPTLRRALELAAAGPGADPSAGGISPAEGTVEALVAEAQRTLAAHSLAVLLAPDSEMQDGDGAPVCHARRVQLRGPYVPPQAQLLRVVAAANGCTVTHAGAYRLSRYPLSTVVGTAADVAAVLALWPAVAELVRQGVRCRSGNGSKDTRTVREEYLGACTDRLGAALTEAVDAEWAAADPMLARAVLWRRDEAVRAAGAALEQ